jgi:hypothetical protein
VSLAVEGFVEVDPSRFADGVLERAFRRFLAGDAPLNYGKGGNVGQLGKVTSMGARGDKVIIGATLETPPAGTALKDAFNKVASGSVRGLAIDGAFTADNARIVCVTVVAVTPVAGTGLLTSIGPSDVG